MRKLLLLISVLSFIHLISMSQQLVEHNLYHYNLSLINPAATAYTPCKQFILTDKHQWTGIEGAPSVQSLGIQVPKPFHKYKQYGLGMNIVRDKNGATQNIAGEFIYSYHITLKTLELQRLSFGLSGKFGQYSFDESDFNDALFDPIVTYGREVEWHYNVAAGVFLYSNKYIAGIGVYNLLPQNTTLYTDYGNNSYFTTAILGFILSSRKSEIIYFPQVYVARDNSFFQVDITNKIYFENKLWTGLCLRKYTGDFYRSGQNALLFLGYEFSNWNFAYTYDLGLNKLQYHHFGSHQLSLTYSICRDKYACPAY